MHISYVSVGATGHVLASLPLVTELVKRGIRVTYFTSENFRAMVEASRAEAGNRAYDLTEDMENPCRFCILEAWASDAAIAEHNASAHFKAFGDFQKDKLARKRVTLLRPVC